jgi:glycosyltransferase involved in cell wall biosynthesis
VPICGAFFKRVKKSEWDFDDVETTHRTPEDHMQTGSIEGFSDRTGATHPDANQLPGTGITTSRQPTALLCEPRVEGHHLVWLRFITEDLLEAGWKLTLALDTRPESMERIRKRLDRLLDRVQVIPVWNVAGRGASGRVAESIAQRLARTGAELAFLDTFDEIASSLLRRAAFGRMPPATLRGRVGGIYLRPRFLAGTGFSPNHLLKALGFARLMRGGWFSHLLFLDPSLQGICQARYPQTPVATLPDPFPDNFAADAAEARRRLEIPEGRRVLLFYGGPYRRKGLHLAVEAMVGLPADTPALLLCAGQHDPDPIVEQGLNALAAQGRARIINRYIFEEEEKQLFAASDAVLLPYINHFGGSAVLTRAVGAGRMVIASDEQLVGRTVRENRLGLLFKSGDAAALRETINQALAAAPEQWQRWWAGAAEYAPQCSRAVFRSSLLESFAAARTKFLNSRRPFERQYLLEPEPRRT